MNRTPTNNKESQGIHRDSGITWIKGDLQMIQNRKTEFLKAKSLNHAGSIFLFLFAVSLVFFTGSCSKKLPEEKIPPRLVQTGTVIQKDIPIYIDSFGTMSSPNNVDIQSQVTGKIKDVHFNEGQEISKGDLLFTIDTRQYKANLKKAEASLDADSVELNLKEAVLKRNKPLAEKNLISKQDFEEYQTDVAAARANIKIDTANIETAKINLEYCSIISPIDGITGERQVDPGNIVPANSGPVLVNIKTIDPLYVDFTVPEKELPRVRKAIAEGKPEVQITPSGNENNTYSGKLESIDNTVDNSTGTISLRGVVPNKDRALWPGQFVDIRLILGTTTNAILAPLQAVQAGQSGNYLFAVTKDNKADLRNVTTGARYGDYILIEKGVQAGEVVVTTGQMGLSPGVAVEDISEEKTQEQKEKHE